MSERLIDDGTYDWSLGQDAWKSPDNIQANQYASGVNLSTRSGNLGPRPPFIQKPLTFEDKTVKDAYGYARPISDIWRMGKFQALIPFFLAPDYYLLTIVCGLIFRTNTRTGFTVLVSKDVRVNQYTSRVNWTAASEYIVIYDFPDYPVLIKGDTATRSDPNNIINGGPQPQVPISAIGTYNQNRLFIANEGVEYTAGDPTGDRFTPEAPATFTEIFNPSSPFYNQFFSLPVTDATNPITAMGFIQELDQNTGIGQLFTATQNKLYFSNTNQPREQWTNGQFAGVLLSNAGIVGPRAFVNVNSDIVFLSTPLGKQGQLYALSTSRNESKRWGNVPISREVSNYLTYNDESLARVAVLGYFNNRIFVSANPYRVQALDASKRPVTDYAHGGFVVIEVESMASLLSQGTPTWSGLWTGINPMDMANVGDRCFVMSKDGCGKGGENALYEIGPDPDGVLNVGPDIVKNRRRPVRSIIYTKQYNFASQNVGEFDLKREHTVAFHLQHLRGRVKLKIDRKPSHSSEFSHYATWEYEAPDQTFGLPSDEVINGFSPHELRQLIFGDADISGCSPINRDEYITFRAIQFRFTIEADYWQLNNFKMRAQLLPYVELAGENTCDALEVVQVPVQCIPDWLIPEESLCQ